MALLSLLSAEDQIHGFDLELQLSVVSVAGQINLHRHHLRVECTSFATSSSRKTVQQPTPEILSTRESGAVVLLSGQTNVMQGMAIASCLLLFGVAAAVLALAGSDKLAQQQQQQQQQQHNWSGSSGAFGWAQGLLRQCRSAVTWLLLGHSPGPISGTAAGHGSATSSWTLHAGKAGCADHICVFCCKGPTPESKRPSAAKAPCQACGARAQPSSGISRLVPALVTTTGVITPGGTVGATAGYNAALVAAKYAGGLGACHDPGMHARELAVLSLRRALVQCHTVACAGLQSLTRILSHITRT